jgi:dephospho-CoA kinase
MGRVFVLGLAGGIGSGKSTVADALKRLGAEVLDADAMVHAMLADPAVARRISRRFGKQVLAPDGAIDRKALGAAAFVSEKTVRELESMLHPEVIRRTKRHIASRRRTDGAHVVVIDAPLLFEAGLDALCDEIFYVHAPKTERMKRVRERRGWTRAELERREKRQKSLDYKREEADLIIRNTASRAEVTRQVRSAWRRIRTFLDR